MKEAKDKMELIIAKLGKKSKPEDLDPSEFFKKKSPSDFVDHFGDEELPEGLDHEDENQGILETSAEEIMDAIKSGSTSDLVDALKAFMKWC